MKIGPFGSALKKEVYVQKGIKVYAQENVFSDDFNRGNYFIDQEKFRTLKSCELFPGDIVISMMGTIGACAVFPKNVPRGIMNSHLLRIEVNKDTVPEYIALLLSGSSLILKQIERLSVGSIMSGLSSKVIKQLYFPVSSYEEEKKIYTTFQKLVQLIAANE